VDKENATLVKRGLVYMEKIIYHGSQNVIAKPQYGYGKPYNDYGLGFYCTEAIGMAKEWAVDRMHDGYANIYSIDTEGLDTFRLDDYTMLHWLTVLLENRSFEVSTPLARAAKEYLLENFNTAYKQADIIIGYRADDSYFSFAQDFLTGAISYRQLQNAMQLGKLGLQFVLKSPLAFERLQYIGYEPATKAEWLSRKMRRDTTARNEYKCLPKNQWQKGDIYITKILEEEMKANDSRLQ